MERQAVEMKGTEAQAEEAVNRWRESSNFWQPDLRVTGDIVPTKKLLAQLRAWMHDSTFNSAVLMRLNFELLAGLGDITEALAAFRTYVDLTRLQALKKKSGARANPDTEQGKIRAFELALELYRGDLASLRWLGAEIQRDDLVMPQANPDLLKRAHGMLARIAVAEAEAAISPESHEEFISLASKHFDAADGGPELLKVQAAFVARTRGPRAAFKIAQPALIKHPGHAGLVNILALLLSAADQLDTALTLTERYLAEFNGSLQELGPHVCRDIVELKKTHIALKESSGGVEAALEALPALTDLIADLFGQDSGPSPPENGVSPESGHHVVARRAFLGLRKRYIVVEDSKSSSKPKDKSSQVAEGYPPSADADLWLWISELYSRANLEGEARRAVEEARPVADISDIHAAIGHIDLAQGHHRRAWRHFSHSLHSGLYNLSAAIGLAIIVVSTSRGERAADTVFDDASQEAGARRWVLSLLENLVVRRGRYVAEAWYSLGSLYETLGDTTASRTALWRAIKLSENRGVREIRLY